MKMSHFKIKEPWWKLSAVGLAEKKLTTDIIKVDILYRDITGDRAYPDTFYVTKKQVMNSDPYVRRGVKLRIVPIERMTVNLDFAKQIRNNELHEEVEKDYNIKEPIEFDGSSDVVDLGKIEGDTSAEDKPTQINSTEDTNKLQVPKIEPVNLLTIHQGKGGEVIGVELWHPINGIWKHLYQDHKLIKYYTDGIGEFDNKDVKIVPVQEQSRYKHDGIGNPDVIITESMEQKEETKDDLKRTDRDFKKDILKVMAEHGYKDKGVESLQICFDFFTGSNININYKTEEGE